MNTKIDRVLFDYDGTLIIHDAENEAMQVASILGLGREQIGEFKIRLADFFQNYFTVNNRKMTKKLYLDNIQRVINPEMFGVTVKAVDEAIVEKSKYTTTLANNAKEVLEYLTERGYQLCVFTNGFYHGQTENMKYKGIYEYFEKIYTWDDFYTKPDIRAFYRALARTAPERNVMVGDSLRADIIPAKELGMYTVGINMPVLDEVLIKPDWVITDLVELKNIL